ncbi:hypothetical protein [Methylobacterium sp. J-090]|uniref:hypothetical protein n=1 Tax=Methylobacterium sp. J-090 TaxID=2836666 RepID=UPI001FB9EF3A|nr:hypothetical protein [Methylobacterium sp. J-090]MCJ2082869.1 hypothetical protein [Methylobacterium sp. J-090]
MRLRLALLTTETKLLRVRHLMRKYDPNQPRVPAGQGGGGQWSPPGGGNGSPGQIQQRTLLDGGGEVLTLRIRSRRDAGDEQHRVITPGGDSRLFENSGDTQTIRDGQSGEILSRGTFLGAGAPLDATVQPVFLPFVVVPAVAATLEAAAFLFTYLAAHGPSFGKAPGTTALRYDFATDVDKKYPLIWVGPVSQTMLNQACPLNREVQAVVNEAAKRLRALYPHLDNTRLGNLIHYDVAATFRKLGYPNVKVELSLDTSGFEIRYGAPRSVRLDLYELTPEDMVCTYDHKTGEAELDPERALRLARTAKKHFPQARGVIMIQIKPQP